MGSPMGAVDWSVWRQLVDLGGADPEGLVADSIADTIADIIATYLEESAARLAELRAALERGELALGRRLAQSFKGLSAGIGARRLTELSHILAADLEQAQGLAEGPDLLGVHWRALQREESRVQDALKGWRQRLLP